MRKILIIEDHDDVRRLIRMTLELEDCELHEAADAPTGWALARAIRPDLVLLDVRMPGVLDGLDVCRAIKSDRWLRNVPVIVLSAANRAADRDAGLAAGADAYLVKPFSPMQLLAVVHEQVPAL